MNKVRYFSAVLLAAAAGSLFGGNVRLSDLILHDGAKVRDDVLELDGKKAYAEIPGTEKYNISRSGLTLACAVRLADTKSRETAKTLDTVFAKEKTPFLFARYDRKMASNLRDEAGKIVVKTRAAKTPQQGQWCHLSVTYEFYDDSVQGETAYITTIYLDGEKLVSEKHPYFQPLQSGGNLLVGKGYSAPWFFSGEIADIFIAPRVLSAGEVGALAASCGKIRKAAEKKSFSEAGTRKIQTPEADFFIRNRSGKGTPVAGIFDKKARRHVLADDLFSWEIRGVRNDGKNISVKSGNAAFSVSGFSEKGFSATWKIRGEASFDVRADYRFTGDGLNASLEVKNLSMNIVIREVVFPRVKIPKFDGNDVLFYPYMCGAEVANPTRNVLRYGQSYSYPSASVSMQYSAYYADGRGVFLGWRDSLGTVKDFSAVGKYDTIEMTWVLPAAIPLDKVSGGNDFRSPGEVSFRLFSGAWYEAAMLHRRWALKEAAWRGVSAPRRDTPRWFIDIPCVLAPNGTDEKSANEGVDQFLFLHKYLELPVYAPWFNWYDGRKRGWPLFPPRPFMPGLFKKIMDSGCRIGPYTDGRLWDTADSEWETRGRKYAAKRADGNIYTERYGRGTYAVMCPGVPAWRDVLVDLSRRIAGLSSAVYHDQITAARGCLCFDKSHGHALNDPALWLDGYRKIYKEIRKAVPDHPHISEDAAEPYLGLFDGGHVWRWGFQGAVPAFQAIYGGRMQYLTLSYDKIATGEPESNFAKMAYSLVNGIKIGRMEVQELFEADQKRLFFKKMSHLFLALSPYFSGGDMLPPLRFAAPVATQSLMWSGHWRRNEKVTTPVVVSNSYKLGETAICIFVNPTPKIQSCQPQIPAGRLCMEGKKEPVDFTGTITLAPRCSAVVVQGSEAEARRIQKTLFRISTFDAGVSYDSRISFPARPPMALRRGELAGADQAAGFFAAERCPRRVTGPDGKAKIVHFFGNTHEKGLISWGIVDFGNETADTIYLHAAVSKNFAGSVVTVLTENAQGEKIPLGRLAVPDTGGWMKFQKIPVKLDRPLKGKMPVLLRFERNGVCNLLGWEY